MKKDDRKGQETTHPDLEPTDGPTPEPEASEQEPELIFGKYRSMEEAERGMHEQARSNAELHRRLKEVEGVLGHLATNPPERASRRPRAVERFDEYGIAPDVVEQAIREVAEPLVLSHLQQQLGPLTQGMQARAKLASQYPDFTKAEAEMSALLEQQPELAERYNRMYGSDPEGAMEWLLGRWERVTKKAHPPPRPAVTNPHAGVPKTGAASQTRAPQTNEPDPEKLQQALEYGRTYGNWAPLLRERLRNVVSNKHLGLEDEE